MAVKFSMKPRIEYSFVIKLGEKTIYRSKKGDKSIELGGRVYIANPNHPVHYIGSDGILNELHFPDSLPTKPIQ